MANKERKDLNTTNGDLGNDYATSSVPISQRRGFFGTAMVWVGWCISLSAFLTGGTIGAGNTLWIGLLAVLAGNLLLFVLGSLCGVIGFRTGRTTYSLFEPMFGRKGSILVSVLRGASAMSFIGVLLNSFANTLTALLPWFPFWLAVLLFGIAILSTSIRGFKGLEWISKIAGPLLWALLALCLYATLKNYGTATLVSYTPEKPLDFLTSMGAAVATWVAGAGMAADLTRYSKKASHVWGGSLIGYILGSALFEAVAVVCAISVGDGNLVVVMSKLGLLIPAVLVLGLALWTTTDNNIYSSSLAFTNAAKLAGWNVPKWVFCVAADAIAMAFAFLGLASKFSVWLSFTGSFCGPLAGMMIAHFLILQGRKNKVFVPQKFRLSAWLAWILAFILSQLTKSAIPSVTAILFGFVLYIVFYYVLDIKLNIHKESLENPVNGEVWDMPTSKEVAAQIAQQEKAAQEK